MHLDTYIYIYICIYIYTCQSIGPSVASMTIITESRAGTRLMRANGQTSSKNLVNLLLSAACAVEGMQD